MSWKTLLPLVSFTLVVCSYVPLLKGDPVTGKLYDDLLKDLNPLEIPVESVTHEFSVRIQLSLLRIRNVDVANGYLEVNVWKPLRWNAYNLRWNPVNYSGVDSIHVPPDRIWTPDISAYYGIWEETDKHDKVLATVNYHGNVVLVPSGIIKTYCEMDTRNYPFETFTCELTFGSWVHTRFEVGIHLMNEKIGIDMRNFVPSTDWKVLESPVWESVRFPTCCPDDYVNIMFMLKLQRRGENIYASAKMTNFVIIGLLLMSCLMGPSSPFRIAMASSALIACFFSQQWYHPAPNSGGNLPLIVYYFVQLCVVSFAVIFTEVLCHHFYFKLGSPPELVKKVLAKSPIPRPLTDDRSYNEQNCTNAGQVSKSRSTPEIGDWKYLAITLDKLFFYFWTLFLIIFYSYAFPTFNYLE